MPKYFVFIIVFVISVQSAFAGKPNKRLAEMDSLRKIVVVHRHARADSIRKNVVPQVFSLGYADTLLQQIEHLHSTLNRITNQSKYRFKTIEIEKALRNMQSTIHTISQSLGRDSTVLNVNNLQLYRVLLQDMEDKLHGWRDVLYADNKDLSGMSAEMNAFVQDSFTQKVAADTAFANLHLDEMLILNDRWAEAQSSTNTNLARIGKLQAAVSGSYFDVTELQNVVGNQLAEMVIKVSAKEYNYIWDVRSNYSTDDVIAFTVQSFKERMSVLAYYLSLNKQDWIVTIVIGLIYFLWVFINFRKIRLAGGNANEGDLELKYILPIPILSTLIFTLNIAPFYGFNQPAIYVEILHLLILIPLSFVFWRIWPRQLFFYWLALVVLSVLTAMMNVVITPGWALRVFLLALNVFSVFVGFRFLADYKKSLSLGRVLNWVTILYLVMNVVSVLANTAGRLTLAKTLTSSAIIGLTQMAGLFVLVPILTEAFYLQMKSRRVTGGMSEKFNYSDIQQGLYQLLGIAAILGWLISFTTNLEIYNGIVFFLDKLLNTPRLVGSTSFSVGNILTFILILYLVSVLQKYVGYFFGETEDDFMGDLEKKESRMVLFRLVIIMVGFFIAVVASGLPVDKVTVVLGALGVGIGLGLQNIVYNLVSGVILIFEKPMQIGDYIEVADKKGRVQSIGIRSSKLITSDGSEVIVPNGDILSSHMVNWTRSNNHRRTELIMEIEPASQLKTAKEIILKALKEDEHVIQELPAEILVNNLSEKSSAISINVWITSIYKEQEFRSEMLSKIYTLLAEKGIKIV